MDQKDWTISFNLEEADRPNAEQIIAAVFRALREKGYDPVKQMVGYLQSGDPTYITSHQDARNLIGRIERDELLEVLVRHYFAEISSGEP